MSRQIKICQGVVCTSRGSKSLMAEMKRDLDLEGESCNDEHCLDYCACTSNCEKGINVRVDDKISHNVTLNNWQEKISNPVENIKKEISIDFEDDFLNDI